MVPVGVGAWGCVGVTLDKRPAGLSSSCARVIDCCLRQATCHSLVRGLLQKGALSSNGWCSKAKHTSVYWDHMVGDDDSRRTKVYAAQRCTPHKGVTEVGTVTWWRGWSDSQSVEKKVLLSETLSH